MTIEVKIIEDSIQPLSAVNKRLTTFQLKYPRFIHSEVMTHRVFSRNASSSRAIPVEKIIQNILDDTAMPTYWGKNQKGMQAGSELTDSEIEKCRVEWFGARDNAIASARKMVELGLHKQHVNRVLEPFSHISVILSGTDFNNAFALRCHPDAQPEIQELFKEVYRQYSTNTPTPIYTPDWHLPYLSRQEKLAYQPGIACRVSAARCCRVSYLKHDGKEPSLSDDLDLFDRLASGTPIHASPLEHQALAAPNSTGKGGNFGNGWIQFRKTQQGETVTVYP